jgi:capsular polysaccharide biosynthesis protein
MRNKIENKIYEIVQNHNEELDMDKMWANLAPQLEKPKKKRPILIFFFLSMILGIGSIYFYSNSDSSINNKKIFVKDLQINPVDKTIGQVNRKYNK